MNTDSQDVSEFAASLRRLLDETGIFSRREWSRFLNVSKAAISQWITDNTVPRPETLRMIVELVRSIKDAPPEPLQQFDAMSANPSVDVSPHGKRMGESVRSYLVSPLVDGFLLDLKGLEPVKQTRVLLKASMLCAEESGLYKPPVAPVYEAKDDVPVQSPLMTGVLERAEAAVKTSEEKISDFVNKIMGYLTSRPSEALAEDVRRFCVHALAVVRSQHNTTPKMLIKTILESKVIDSSRFDRFFDPDALNAVFLADEETTILVRQPNGEYMPWRRIATEIEQDVLTLRGHEVLYCPAERLASFYKYIKPRELQDAA